MANKTVQLKSSDGDNLFPRCGEVQDDSIGTSNIQSNAITGDKLDWPDIVEWIPSTTSVTEGSYVVWVGPQYIKMADGVMIVYGTTPSFTINANSTRDYNYTLDTPFLETPTVFVGIMSDSTGANVGDISVSNNYSTTTQIKMRMFNGSSTQRVPHFTFCAIGRWK